LTKNSQLFGKKFQKTAGEDFFGLTLYIQQHTRLWSTQTRSHVFLVEQQSLWVKELMKNMSWWTLVMQPVTTWTANWTQLNWY